MSRFFFFFHVCTLSDICHAERTGEASRFFGKRTDLKSKNAACQKLGGLAPGDANHVTLNDWKGGLAGLVDLNL